MAERTALVTGGTGALGAAVVDAFLDAGWRTVVDLDRAGGAWSGSPGATGSSSSQADLFDPEATAAAVEAAAAEPSAPLRAVANLVGGFAGGTRTSTRPPIEDFERLLRLNLRPRLSGHPGCGAAT